MRMTLDPDNGLLRQAQDLAGIGAAAVLTRKGLKPLIECESAAARPACWQRQAGRAAPTPKTCTVILVDASIRIEVSTLSRKDDPCP